MFRIVVVEDEPLILQSICEKIRSVDPDFKIVGEYENGEFAMLELELVKPHVLLTDIYMPVMDGLTLIGHVKKNSPSTVCAVLTGYRDFEYARRAIELGVSDYLLKPPLNDILAKFLGEVKARLWQNQALVEGELLRQWANRQEDDRGASVGLKDSAKEYFYFTRYMVLYEWMPRQLAGTAREHEVWQVDDLLLEGEKIYRIPFESDGRRAVVIGVHVQSDERLQQFADRAAMTAGASAACIAAASVNRLSSGLFPALAKLQRRVYSGFPLEGRRSLLVHDSKPALGEASLVVTASLGHELISLLLKERKSDFLKRLELLFQTEPWRLATRAQWLQSLLFLIDSWKLQHVEFARRLAEIHWRDDLEDAVWGAEDSAALVQSLKELFGSIYEWVHGGKELEALWTDELKSYLETCYMDNISLTTLADRYSLNASYLGRVFKRKYGHSPIDFLIQVRIDRAKKLICDKPRLLFKDVAELVGYTDPFYFSKLFKQWTGQTPREFKKQTAAE